MCSNPLGPAEEPVPISHVYPVEKAHLFEPFWKSKAVYGEMIAPIREPGSSLADGTLLFEPERILAIRSPDGSTIYEEGRDYSIDRKHRRLVLTPQSKIPFLDRKALYTNKKDEKVITDKVNEPNVYLVYSESWFLGYQVEVDYIRNEPWTGFTPHFAGNILPKTVAKLKAGETLKIGVTGDSISTGCTASRNNPPFAPGYVTLLQMGLEKAYGTKVKITNLAVGGTTATQGLANIAKVIEEKPDLVIIAFGMNDSGQYDVACYSGQIAGMISAVNSALPDTEILLVASSLPNPEWSWAQASQFPKYRDALKLMMRPGIALADMTSLYADILARKRYLDLTGNGLNHTNDYGHRLYAQAILALLRLP